MTAREIRDSEVRLLAGLAATLRSDYIRPEEEDAWTNSPFAWIKTLPSRQVGKIGEQLVAGWCAAKGFDVTKAPDQEADRVIEGRRVEIKFSTLWASGSYKFQQIRDQNYSYVICLGIAPFDAHCWVISKGLLRKHVIGHTPQHRGRSGTDTFWLTVVPDEPHDWLKACGGQLSAAHRILAKVAKSPSGR